MITYTATYSPDDNKLRLYASSRLDAETFQRVKAAGFKWAPRQELFVAPMWTPGREDLLLELCGEIGDEDTSLVDRAEERAERFDGFRENRAKDAARAQDAVSALADGIPLGQPILVGHHSERHARRDAQKIENGMRKAAKMWETSQYWTDRAAGAIRHAAYKERPDVRARRIKTIETELRKIDRWDEEHQKGVELWNTEGLTPEIAHKSLNIHIGSFRMAKQEGDVREGPDAYHAIKGDYPNSYAPRTWDEVLAAGRRVFDASKPSAYARWREHYNNRLAYERAMLDEQGGNATNKYDLQPGGRVLCRETWYTIVKVNKKNGAAVSVTVAASYRTTKTVGEILGYEPPTEEEAARVKSATKLAPLCNYPGEGFVHMTRAELDGLLYRKWSDFPKIGYRKATETTAAHRVQQARKEGESFKYCGVFVTDQKRKDPPSIEDQPEKVVIQGPESTREPRPIRSEPAEEPAWKKAQAIKDALKNGGVQVVSANQLFVTPRDLASRVIEMAGIQDGHRVLEPSAGTGRLLEPLRGLSIDLVAVEINCSLAKALVGENLRVVNADFLQVTADQVGTFDRIVMNPPFENASDIKHIEHAAKLLNPGGILVAICAGGPRQKEKLEPLSSYWEPLPAGTFESSGTGVNTVLLTIEK